MAKWTKNHRMEIGAVLLVLGLVLTVVSFSLNFSSETPSWLASYKDLVETESGEDWNLVVMIVGPIVLISGGFYVGEQFVLRRRFERLIDTPKRSEFTSRRRDLEDIAKRLPDGFTSRIKEKESEFVSRRSA